MEQTIPSTSASRPQSGTFETNVKTEPRPNEANASGVSWAAVIAGAFVAAALSLILLALGTGVGFSSISVWSNVGASASMIGAAAIVWLILMQIVSSSMGGYLAGRLRTKWASLHTDEVYFRDTAHGFLAWAVALVITAVFLTSAATSMVGARTPSRAVGVAGAQSAQPDQGDLGPNDYFVDMLFRSDDAKPDPIGAAVRSEAGRIFANALRQREIPPADKGYLTQLVATRTGLTQPNADKRVSEVFVAAQQAADTARKVIAHSLLWAFLALLIGAFCASFAATIGGRQRDHVVVVNG
jgi:signal transduction histidine kinase